MLLAIRPLKFILKRKTLSYTHADGDIDFQAHPINHFGLYQFFQMTCILA